MWLCGLCSIVSVSPACHAQTSTPLKQQQSRGIQPQSASLVDEYIERGVTKTDNGDFQGAIRDFDAAIRNSLANVLAYRYRSYARLQVQDYNGTINDCSEVLRINPRDSNAAIAYLYRAYAKFALGQFAGVTHDCTSALELDPYADDAISLRGQARMELNDYTGAKNDFTDALNMNHANATYFFMRGQVRARTRDFIGAIGDFTTTLQLEPQAFQAYLHRGLAKLSMNDQSACDDFKAASKLGLKDAAPLAQKYCAP
jgi:tetratricopeptide (TPR) repeat protein